MLSIYWNWTACVFGVSISPAVIEVFVGPAVFEWMRRA